VNGLFAIATSYIITMYNNELEYLTGDIGCDEGEGVRVLHQSDIVVDLPPRPSFKILGARCVSSSTDTQVSSSFDMQLCSTSMPNHVCVVEADFCWFLLDCMNSKSLEMTLFSDRNMLL
jgi:hypothetical protein